MGRLAPLFLCFLLGATASLGQLSGRVGPTTTTESKRKSVCNVLKYGAVADKTTDIGPAIQSAFAACKNGGTGESGSRDVVGRTTGRAIYWRTGWGDMQRTGH